MIGIEIGMAVSMILVVALQSPGITSEGLARRRGMLDSQRRKAAAADAAQLRFYDKHPFASRAFGKGGGIVAFAAGLGVLFLSDVHPAWLHKAMIIVGLSVQVAAVIAFDICGLMSSFVMYRAVRKASH